MVGSWICALLVAASTHGWRKTLRMHHEQKKRTYERRSTHEQKTRTLVASSSSTLILRIGKPYLLTVVLSRPQCVPFASPLKSSPRVADGACPLQRLACHR